MIFLLILFQNADFYVLAEIIVEEYECLRYTYLLNLLTFEDIAASCTQLVEVIRVSDYPANYILNIVWVDAMLVQWLQ